MDSGFYQACTTTSSLQFTSKNQQCVCVCVCVCLLWSVFGTSSVRFFFSLTLSGFACSGLGMLVLCFLPFFPSSFAFPVSCPGQVACHIIVRKLLFPISLQLKGTRLRQENQCCFRLTIIIRLGVIYVYICIDCQSSILYYFISYGARIHQ